MGSKPDERNYCCHLKWEHAHSCRPEVNRWSKPQQSLEDVHSTYPGCGVLLGGQRNPEGNTCWYCKWKCGWLGAALPGLGRKQGSYRAERFPEPQGLSWFTGADLIPIVTLLFVFLILCWGLYRVRWDNLKICLCCSWQECTLHFMMFALSAILKRNPCPFIVFIKWHESMLLWSDFEQSPWWFDAR